MEEERREYTQEFFRGGSLPSGIRTMRSYGKNHMPLDVKLWKPGWSSQIGGGGDSVTEEREEKFPPEWELSRRAGEHV